MVLPGSVLEESSPGRGRLPENSGPAVLMHKYEEMEYSKIGQGG